VTTNSVLKDCNSGGFRISMILTRLGWLSRRSRQISLRMRLASPRSANRLSIRLMATYLKTVGYFVVSIANLCNCDCSIAALAYYLADYILLGNVFLGKMEHVCGNYYLFGFLPFWLVLHLLLCLS